MLRFLILLTLSAMPFAVLDAQDARKKRNVHYLELGMMLGGTQYSGDVAQQDWELNQTRAGFGAFARYHLLHELMVKGQVYYGFLSGDDRNSTTMNIRKYRFFTPVLESSLVLEYVPFALERMTKTGMHNAYFSPYIFAGIGHAYTSRVETEYYGTDADRSKWLLVPFPEDGKTSRQFTTVPFGFGMRFDYLERFSFGAELGWRPVFSDLLDGVSINGNPKQKDWYYFFGLTASYFINQPWKPLP